MWLLSSISKASMAAHAVLPVYPPCMRSGRLVRLVGYLRWCRNCRSREHMGATNVMGEKTYISFVAGCLTCSSKPSPGKGQPPWKATVCMIYAILLNGDNTRKVLKRGGGDKSVRRAISLTACCYNSSRGLDTCVRCEAKEMPTHLIVPVLCHPADVCCVTQFSAQVNAFMCPPLFTWLVGKSELTEGTVDVKVRWGSPRRCLFTFSFNRRKITQGIAHFYTAFHILFAAAARRCGGDTECLHLCNLCTAKKL